MSKRFINSIDTAIKNLDEIDYVYGMIKKIDDDDQNFLFSAFGLCDNWQILPYSSIKSHRNLGGMRCIHDHNVYPYFRLEFTTNATIDIVEEDDNN